jgi:hypothetical protein
MLKWPLADHALLVDTKPIRRANELQGRDTIGVESNLAGCDREFFRPYSNRSPLYGSVPSTCPATRAIGCEKSEKLSMEMVETSKMSVWQATNVSLSSIKIRPSTFRPTRVLSGADVAPKKSSLFECSTTAKLMVDNSNLPNKRLF